ALNTSVSVNPFGKLVLDNSGTVVANRISDTSGLSLNGGGLQLNGNSTTPVQGVLGPLDISGVSKITITQPGSASAELSFPSLQRNGHATVNIDGAGVHIGGLSNDNTGIVPPYVTIGNEWASVGGDNRLSAFSGYTTDINSGSADDNVKLSGA